jgi:hypothetical protein
LWHTNDPSGNTCCYENLACVNHIHRRGENAPKRSEIQIVVVWYWTCVVLTEKQSKKRNLELALLGTLGGLVDKGLVNVRNHTTTSNGGLDECIQLLVTTNSKL